MEQKKIYSQQLVAEVLSQTEPAAVNGFVVYDKGQFVGKLSYEELSAFVNQKDKCGDIYAHKMNFDIGTALFSIKRMHAEPQNESAGKNIFHQQLLTGLSAVAVVALVVSMAWLFFKQDPVPAATALTPSENSLQKIMLTLPDGKKIALEEAKAGLVVKGESLNYTDGSQLIDHVVLSAKGDASRYVNRHGQSAVYSQSMILNVSRTGMYRVELPDGSKVWLNSSSTLKFPATFDGAVTRRVELNGEAYFEIAKVLLKSQYINQPKRRMPFIVVTDKQEIEVLGTHFNVSAYQNEKSVKTTLMEGSVRLRPAIKRDKSLKVMDPAFLDPMTVEGAEKSYGDAIVLKPNEQATLTGTDLKVKKVDADEALAWTTGDYVFRNMPLESITRMLTRWYDVEVVYKDQKLGEILLGGAISKSSKINDVLKMLELSANVHFKIDGKRVTVVE